MPFNADDIDKGLPGWQLYMAGFLVPDILIEAYRVSGRNEFLTTARDVILAWASYERTAWLPKGLLWNDHAIAARALVLTKFWRHYRNHHEFRSDEAMEILQLAARSRKFLARPSHFTFATNHGIMQNLALWHLCLSFPTLPDVDIYKQVALERLHDQMKFYINDEGIVLEHSAEYHRDGLGFISLIFRYLTLLDMTIPEEWIVKFEKAKEVYAQLRRPDGSLPAYGDTGGGEDSNGPPVASVNVSGRSDIMNFQKNWMPEQSISLYPVAGYSVWWDGLDNWPDEQKLNQTTVVWSYFPGQAHKHADELSVLLYAGGQTWWTNAGYWTYGTKGRSEAVSWGGSNAPHLVGEDVDSMRHTTLKFHGWSDRLAVIDVERNGPNKYIARRQVVHLKPNLWIVIDRTTGDQNSQTSTTWTTHPDVRLSEGKLPESYYLKGEYDSISLTAFFITSEGTIIKRYRGSYTPFAGWVKNKPADALVIEQPANNSWSVAIWSLRNHSDSSMHVTEKPYMQNRVGPESWEIVLPQQTGQMNIGRDGNRVYVSEVGETRSIQEVKLEGTPNGIADNYHAIRTAFKNAANKYPQFKNLLHYRWKMTYFLIFILITQEVFFIIYKMRKGVHYTGLRIIAMIGWFSIIGVWQFIVYLKG